MDMAKPFLLRRGEENLANIFSSKKIRFSNNIYNFPPFCSILMHFLPKIDVIIILYDLVDILAYL